VPGSAWRPSTYALTSGGILRLTEQYTFTLAVKACGLPTHRESSPTKGSGTQNSLFRCKLSPFMFGSTAGLLTAVDSVSTPPPLSTPPL